MKILNKFLIILSLFLFLIIINFQIVYAISETFQLTPWGIPITRNVELQKNERFVGSFTITNLQTWKNGWGDTQSISVSITILDPKGQTILSYTKTKGDSFDYTAFYSGVYTIKFSAGSEYLPPSGIANPNVNFNYDVISNSQSELSQSTSNNPFNWLILPLIIAIVVVVSIGIVIIVYYAKKGK